MSATDIFLVVIILLVFAFLICFNQIAISFADLKEQWPIIRCNPLAMPFASSFGFDTSENFNYCVQDMQTKYLSYLLEPLNYNFGVIGKIASSFADSLSFVRDFLDNIRTFFSDIIGGIFGVFLNILVEVQRLTINIKDMMSKIVGVVTTIMYTIDGGMMTMQSTWEGPPGQLTRELCFHPDTQLLLKDGSIVLMKDIKLNSVLQNGSIVRAVLKISNINDETGKHIEKFYIVKGGVNNSYILVTGSHLVIDPNTNKYVQVKELKESIPSNITTDKLSCLITSDHKIPIGSWVFHDWEDNNGSPSKSL
jgi:hypothetical protein